MTGLHRSSTAESCAVCMRHVHGIVSDFAERQRCFIGGDSPAVNRCSRVLWIAELTGHEAG